MSVPSFTPEERYIIDYFKASASPGLGRHAWQTIFYVLPAVLLFAVGVYYNNMAVLFASFGLLVLYHAWQISQHPRTSRKLASIFNKYEQCVGATPNEG